MRKIAKQKKIDLARRMLGQLDVNSRLQTLLDDAGMRREAMLAEGERLFAAAERQIDEQNRLCGQLMELWADMYRRHDAAWPKYMELRGVVKARYGRRGLAGLLGLDKPAARTRPKQLVNMDTFYHMALNEEETIAGLERIGITRAELEAGSAAVAAMKTLDSNIMMAEGEKQQATVDENRALEALERWRRRTYKYIELATEDHPSLRKAVKE